MDKLTKEEYRILYYISRGRNSMERLEGMFEKEMILKDIIFLEKKKLIKISYRDGEIYGFMETEEGNNLLTAPEYQEWYQECGD